MSTLPSSACCCCVDTGLSASEVLSTSPKPISDLSISIVTSSEELSEYSIFNFFVSFVYVTLVTVVSLSGRAKVLSSASLYFITRLEPDSITSLTSSSSSLAFNSSVKLLSDNPLPSSASTFASNAFCVAVEIGLLASLVLSTLPRPISDLSISIVTFFSVLSVRVTLSSLLVLSYDNESTVTSSRSNVLSEPSRYETTMFPSTKLTSSTLSSSNLSFNSFVKSLLDKPFPSSLSTLSFNASFTAFDIGLFKSDVLSTLSSPISPLSISIVTLSSESSDIVIFNSFELLVYVKSVTSVLFGNSIVASSLSK